MSIKKIIVFTGAGVSAESGLQTFRDSNGLWEGYQVEEVATPRAWKKNPALVLQFYNERRRNVLESKPNAAHLFIATLEKTYEVQVITQNIDDLHEQAGSSSVLHLHGEIFKMRSEKADAPILDIRHDINLGDCAPDGAQLRPHIVWFEEAVPEMANAIQLAKQADLFIIIGTSLVVYPAASLLQYIPAHIPVVVLDKKIPVIQRNNLYVIEKPATEGVEELNNLLLELLSV